LPRDDDPESDRIAPQQGGPSDATAHPTRTTTRPTPPPPEDDDEDNEDADARGVTPVLHAARLRVQARLGKLPAAERAAAFWADLDRWHAELLTDLTPLVGADEALRLSLEANFSTLTDLLAGEAAA
jgi:hypothetical protein